MASRWRLRPGGATQRGSGWRAKSTACSASLRNPLVTTRSIPSDRAAASIRSNAAATAGHMGLPSRYTSGPE